MTSFGDVLRHYRERRALTQDAAAGLVGVSRATFTQWETNKHLPSLQRGHDLDQKLEAGGDLLRGLTEARARSPRSRTVASRPVVAEGPTLAQVRKRARQELLGQMCFEDGQAVGWRHNLVESPDPSSILPTTFGLGALALLGGPDAHTPTVVDRMVKLGVLPDGTITGWKAQAQREPRFETTSAAINSLWMAGVPLQVDEIVRVLTALLDQTAGERPFILTLALEPLLRAAPDHPFTAEVVSLLLDHRRDFGGTLLWPEKRVRRNQPRVEPSIAHNARAIIVLREAPADLVGDAVDSATDWLTQQTNLDGVTEVVRRAQPDGTVEELAFHHFTSALVVQALAGADRPDHKAIERALIHVWERYVPDIGLWAWGNGDVPVWLLVDAVVALQAAAFASVTGPPPVSG